MIQEVHHRETGIHQACRRTDAGGGGTEFQCRGIVRKGDGHRAGGGAPVAQDLQIRTYRGIPYQAQFLASDGEGDDITYAVEEAPGKEP